MGEIELTIRQLARSRTFQVAALASVVVSPLLPQGNHLAPFVIVTGVMVAVVTSVHEMEHVRKSEELGHPIGELEVLGLGNVRYELDSPPEVRREVARAPYFSRKPYLVEVAFLLVLTAIAASAISPYRYLLLASEAIPLTHFVSTVCAHLTFRGHGCRKLAMLASPEDLREGLGDLRSENGEA